MMSQLEGILTVKEWDNSSIKQRNKLLKQFHERYTCDGIDGYDIDRMEDELNKEIVLLMSRIVAALETMLQKSHSYSLHYYICTLCALITTSEGQIFAETSPNIITVLMQCLQFDIKIKEDDLMISLIMIRRSCIFNEKLRAAIVDQNGIDILGSILQQKETSQKVQEAACTFLLDLSTLNQNTSAALSNILRTLLNTPFLVSKHAAIKIISSILITASPVVVNFIGWEQEFIVQMTRVLICAPLQYQYDAGELISMLFESDNEAVRNGLMSVISGLLCVRYTLGGTPIVDPPQQWEYLFPRTDQEVQVSEVPEILASVVIMTTLSSLDDLDLANISSNVTQLKAKFDILTTHLRTSKLHRSLLSHILWYVREKTVLHKVLSIWVDRTELNLQSSDSDHHKTKFRKVAKVARQWIQRKSSVSGANLRCTTPPELRRASVLLKSSTKTDATPSINDTDATSQDLACINSIRVLQKWLELDQVAHEDVIYDLSQLGYERQVAYISLENGTEVIDLLPTLSNIVRVIKAHGSENQQVGKNSFFSTYLSQLVTPGELVKSLKVNLSNALQYDMGSIYPTNAALSTSSSSTYFDNFGGFQNQESVYDNSIMPPPLQDTDIVKSESTVSSPKQSSKSIDAHIEPLHALPSPPLDSGSRYHRSTVREKRSNSNFYTKQYSLETPEHQFQSPTKMAPVSETPRMILRDGPSKGNAEKPTVLTPQDRLSLSTLTPQKPVKLGELKPSPPKGSPSDGAHPSPESPEGVSPGKGRFVRQSLLRQRSSLNEDVHGDKVEEPKNSQRLSFIGGIQHGVYSQPTPPSTNHSSIRPHSRGRIVGNESGNTKPSESLNGAGDILEQEYDDNLSIIAVTTDPHTDLEHHRLDQLNAVVNQLINDEENLLAELESHNIVLSSSMPLVMKKYPLSDPLIPSNTKSRSNPLSSTQHAPPLFPDPTSKLKTSYPTAVSQRKEMDHLILHSLANSELRNDKTGGATRHHRDSNAENRTYFPGIC